MKTYGAELRRRIDTKGMTARTLAEKLGKSTSFISDLENGRKANLPDAWVLRAFSRELDWPVVDQLLAFGYLEPDDLSAPDDAVPVREIVGMVRRVRLNPERESFLRGVLVSMLDFDRAAAPDDAEPPTQSGVA